MGEDKKEEAKREEAEKREKQRIFQGFYNFLKDYSVIGLAIGVVIAQTSTNLVNAIVKGVFTPLIELMTPGHRLENLVFEVSGAKFDIGSILNSLLTFLIVMGLLYLVVMKILKKEDYIKKK